MQNQSVVSSALEVEDVVFSVLSWLGPDLLFVYRRVTKTFKRTIDHHFVPAPLSMGLFCSPLSMFNWAINEGGCPEKLRWFVEVEDEEEDEGSIFRTTPFHKMRMSAETGAQITARAAVDYFMTRENKAKEYFITEGHDAIYRKFLSENEIYNHEDEDGECGGIDCNVHSGLYGGLNLLPHTIGNESASTGTSKGWSVSWSASQAIFEEQLGIKLANSKDKGRYVFEKQYYGKNIVQRELVSQTSQMPNHPNCYHAMYESDNVSSCLKTYEVEANRRSMIQTVPDHDLDKLFCRAGVLAVSDTVLGDIRYFIRFIIVMILNKAILYPRNDQSNVITTNGVLHGLRRCGIPMKRLYGYGLPKLPPSSFSSGIFKVLRAVCAGRHLTMEALAVCNDFISGLLIDIMDVSSVELHDCDNSCNAGDDSRESPEVIQVKYCENGDGNDAVTITMAHEEKCHHPLQTTVDWQAVEGAVLSLLRDELQCFALHAGKSAMSNFAMKFDTGELPEDDFGMHADLEFSVFGVTLAASRTHKGVLLTPFAAVYLTAVLEFMCNDIIEMSADATEFALEDITPRHMFVAMRDDEHMNAYTQQMFLRDGGVLPCIHKDIINKPLARRSSEEQFHDVFVEMLDATEDKILVDPRDGLHKYLRDGNHLYTMPELDAVCAVGQCQRHISALTHLNDSHREILERSLCDGYQIQRKRLEDIDAAVDCVEYAIQPVIFRRMVCQLSGAVSKEYLLFTVEAYAALQLAIEQYLHDFLLSGYHNALHCQRIRLLPSDLNLFLQQTGFVKSGYFGEDHDLDECYRYTF